MEKVSTCNPWRTHPGTGGCLKGAVTQWTAHSGAGLLVALVTHGGSTLEHSVPEGLLTMEETHTGTVYGGLQPVGRTHVGKVHRRLSHMGVTPHWSRGKCEEPSP